MSARYHHFLRDYAFREDLYEHLKNTMPGTEAAQENIRSILAWRDGIAEAWGHTFVHEDGTYMRLYEAWVHGSKLMRGRVAHTPAVPPHRGTEQVWHVPAEAVEDVEFDEVVPF